MLEIVYMEQNKVTTVTLFFTLHKANQKMV